MRARERRGSTRWGRLIVSTALLLAILHAATSAGAQASPVAFDPSTFTPATACEGMAIAAQSIADQARAAHPGDDAAALQAFDAAFAEFYIGQPMRTLADAFVLLRADGPARGLRPGSPYFGETGFLPEFLDTGTVATGMAPTEVDQTHHATAYISSGINGLELVARLHAAVDNHGDARLGAAAYSLGEDLAAEPSRLAIIGDTLRQTLCDPAQLAHATWGAACHREPAI